MVQRWQVNKDTILNDYSSGMQYPILLLYYAGNDFWTLFRGNKYRVEELQCWMRYQLTQRMKQQKVTIIAGNPVLQDMAGANELFGECNSSEHFVFAALGGLWVDPARAAEKSK